MRILKIATVDNGYWVALSHEATVGGAVVPERSLVFNDGDDVLAVVNEWLCENETRMNRGDGVFEPSGPEPLKH